MHSHIHAISPNLVNQYSATELYRTAAAERAGEVRRKLLDASREVEVRESAESELTLGGRSEAGAEQRRGRRTPVLKSDDVENGLDQVVEPISVWA